jgi:hypothetical protein
MKKLSVLTALAAALALRSAPGAEAASSTFVNSGNPGDGLLAYHVSGGDAANRGYSLDYGTTSIPGWGLGLEQTYGDFYLFNYNYVNGTNNGVPNTVASNNYWLRMRGDTGQLALGYQVGHPANGWQQMAIAAGTGNAPLDGLGITAYGFQNNLNLGQGMGMKNHTDINFAGLWQLGTDIGNTGGKDMFVWDLANSKQPLQISNATDLVTMNYGATVNGTATVNGLASLPGGATIGGNLQHTGSQLGFYGTAPVTKPVVSGCTCDGSALKSLIQALASQGLVIDNTTP